jgi:putative transposase
MIDPGHDLPVVRQAELLDLSRSNVYYLPRPVSEADLVLMRRIDELHLNPSPVLACCATGSS